MSERAPFSCSLAEELAPSVLERFLRYVKIDTQADPYSTSYPSTTKQLELSRLLVRELQEIGLDDVTLTEHGYVLASLPGTSKGPVIGLIAHVDTSPDAPGSGVAPIVHEAYDGGDLVLPGDPSQVLRPVEEPELAARVGHDIVTSDGTTLLGADDKAGVAEIVTALAYLHHDPSPRAPLRIAFTVDEEVGRGTDHLDVDAFGADYAYTFDGSGSAIIEAETFSATAVTVTIQGRGTHPGTAKGALVNSVKLAADLIAALPRDSLSPETTEEREGFVHPVRVTGNAEETTIELIARDHDDALLDEHVALLERLARDVEVREPRARVRFEADTSYRNMRPVIDRYPEVLRAAEDAIRRVGLEPQHGIIRGGTDGSRLSERGLPTPNIFTGGQRYHARTEWASVQDMAAAAATAVELARVWGEPGRLDT